MASTRRTRYSFLAEDRRGTLQQGHILAYDAETVWRWLEKRGYCNIEVKRAAKRRAAASVLPPAWEVDRSRLAALAAYMGVEWPVEIRRTAALRTTGGATMRKDTFGRKHLIVVAKDKTPERASEIIAHELRHAAQYEACGSWAAVLAEHKRQARIPYAARPWEIEARAAEPLGRKFMPARAATRQAA
jgi:hypothetical protein